MRWLPCKVKPPQISLEMTKGKNYFDTFYRSIENSIRIDSLKLRIPITLTTITDKSIFDHYAETNLNTGEIAPEEFKLKAKEYKFSETSKVKILIERRSTAKERIEDCLVIYLNSKILRERYFEGLHFDLIKDVYNDLISLNVFHVDYETFLRSDCTDIDLKFDEQMKQEEWNLLLDQFMKATIPSNEADKGYKRFKPTAKFPFQNGLMYNKRASATASRPFLKLYWKGGEMITKSEDFRAEHLSQLDQDKLKQFVRIETTIKDKRHASKLGIENITLLGLLSLNEKTKEQVFRTMISKYLHRPKRRLIAEAPKDDRMTPEQQIQYYSIVLLMEHTTHNADEVINSLIQGIPTKQTRYRKKKDLTLIYDRYIKGNKIDLSNEKINSFFNKFEWV